MQTLHCPKLHLFVGFKLLFIFKVKLNNCLNKAGRSLWTYDANQMDIYIYVP